MSLCLAFVFLVIIFPFANAQTASEHCKYETFTPPESSGTFQNVYWDFCVGDLMSQPIGLWDIYDKPNFAGAIALTLVDDRQGNFFSYVPAPAKDKLIRLGFQEDLSEQATIVDLGNVGDALNTPRGISLVRYEGSWLGFVINRDDLNLVILDFGDNLESQPSVTTHQLTSITQASTVNAVINSAGELVVFIADAKSNALLRLIWSDLAQAPTIDKLTVEGISGTVKFDIIQEGDDWYGVIVSVNYKLIKLFFLDSIAAKPVYSFISINPDTIYQPFGVRLLSEAGKKYAFVQVREGTFYRLNFGTSFANQNPEIITLGNFGISNNNYTGFWIEKTGTTWVGAWLSYARQTLYTFSFPENCSAVPAFSTEPNPEVYYTEARDYTIEQSGYDENGQLVNELYTVTVKDEAAPPAEIEASTFSSCVTSGFVFNVSERSLGATYRWYVNGETYSGTELNYYFPSPDSYILRLDAENASGCTNSKSVTVHALAEPQPTFTPQFEGSLCSNQPVTFANETGFTPDSVISYSWDFGDGATSAEVSPEHRFEEAGTYLVKLTATIPGCNTEFTQTLEVAEGPATAFEFSSSCLGEPTVFANQTTGDAITAYRWDLGDGNFYSGENPIHRYQEAGTYLVRLEADNATGCTTSITQSLHITDRPEAAFEVAPICEKNPVHFMDISQDAEGNIVNWQWDFGDAAEPAVSSEQSPWVNFGKAGTYEVQLITESNFGCRDTISQTVSVSALPQPAMQLTAACAGEMTSLADVSTTKEIRSRLWMVEGKAYTDSAFQLSFAEAGQYPVRLQLNLKNGCAVSLTDTLEVLPLPAASLQAKQACANQQTTLWLEANEELSLISWKVEGTEVAGSEAKLKYSFPEAGSYLITTDYKNQNGCVNSLTTTLDVIPAPEAAFSLSAEFGVTPMKVQLSNQSQRAVRYQWFIDGAQEAVSAELAPDFTFSEAGVYEITLVAYNAAGCSDTYTQTLEAVPAYFDIALKELDVFELAGEGRIALTLDNLGYIPAEEIEIEIQLNEAIRLKETYTGLIEAGTAERYVLDARLQTAEAGAVRSVCVQIQPKLQYVDEEGDMNNNQACVSLSKQAVVHAPRPNPSSGDVVLDLVLTNPESVSLRLFSLQGEHLWERKADELAAGLQRLNVPLQQFARGIYLLQLEHGGEQQTFRLNKL